MRIEKIVRQNEAEIENDEGKIFQMDLSIESLVFQ